MKAISLFSSAGIGDLGLRNCGIKTIINNEILKNRMDLFSANFLESTNFLGDIWELKDEIIHYYRSAYQEELFLILATPPCQGMSTNGAGKLLHEFRNGRRPKLDERNRLIIPTLDIITTLKPSWVILENVPNMENTLINDENNNLINIIDYIEKRLGTDYVGGAEVIDVADYGIPQRRRRLITIFTRNENGKNYYRLNKTFLPRKTHSKDGIQGTKKWVTLKDAIYDMPKLDAKKGFEKDTEFHPLHRVPILTEEKYFWVSHTKEGDTAFNNQCINEKCGYQFNTRHGASINQEGINKYNIDTPLYCEQCGALLPRPYKKLKSGKLRIMRGYTSAYKRMSWDDVASTLTQNFQYACSDNKLHPSQNRVLSLYEALVLQTISNYDYSFEINGKMSNVGLIRDIIGESVPPKMVEMICKNIIAINNLEVKPKDNIDEQKLEQLAMALF